MMHKSREAVGQRDDLYKLEGMIEFDQAYGIGFYSQRAAKGERESKEEGCGSYGGVYDFGKP
jgi:hypothetical protein